MSDRSNTRNVAIPSARMLNFKKRYMIDLDLNLAAEICLESSYFPCFFFQEIIFLVNRVIERNF